MASSLSPRRSSRPGARDRHGRGIRAAVTGPHLPALRTRVNVFDGTVAGAAGYLRDMWPHELGDVRFEVAAMPESASPGARVDRWVAVPEQKRIVLFRLPIERFARLHRRDELHRRMVIESCVFRAVADYLGKDPWELSPDHFGHRH